MGSHDIIITSSIITLTSNNQIFHSHAESLRTGCNDNRSEICKCSHRLWLQIAWHAIEIVATMECVAAGK